MCGLFGWQLNKTIMEQGDVTVLATLLAAGAEHRGNESWGVVMSTPGQLPAVVKNIGSIKQTCRVPSIVAPQVIGHTRKATTGAVTTRNAHPFSHGKIIGAHNGFIFDHDQLNKEYNREFEVDSEHLIAHIADGVSLLELSGMGTVSYLNTDNPGVVYLGRGQNSDLVVYGIGEDKDHPDGIVWGSIAYWVKEAIEMSHVGPYFMIQTNMRRLYRVDNYDIEDVSDFPLGQGRSRAKAIHQADTREIGLYPNCGVHNYGYRGRTHFDAYDKGESKKQQGQIAQLPELNSVSRRELDELPSSLKKNPQKCSVSGGEEEKVVETTVQCDGCNDWGPLVTSFEVDAGGILKHEKIDSMLCFTCTLHWGQETGTLMPPVKAPSLVIKSTKNGVIEYS